MIRPPTDRRERPPGAGHGVPAPPRPPAAAAPEPKTGLLGPALAGWAVIAATFGGLGAWAALAPLHSAAVAPGVVAVDGSRKTVQHLEGGIIAALLVREDSPVAAGQVLLRLSDAQPRATLELLRGQLHAQLALEARLLAERDGRPRVRFPDELLERRGEPDAAALMAAQERLFQVRREALASQAAILRRRIAQYGEEIAGLEAQVAAQGEQIAYLTEEIGAVERLLASGNALKPRLLELRRARAGVEGGRGENRALIARARQKIAEAEQQTVDLGVRRLNEVADELQRVQAEIFDQRERVRAAADVLERLEVRAPQAGRVVGLRFHTPGGVIAPGEPILDLVPRDDRLVVEARVRPEDIDVVHAGLPARVRLTAYSARTTPTIEGAVARVSADRLEDAATHAPYYLARIELDPASLAEAAEVALQPGMPAEVLIVTGERTALQYALAPLANSLHRAAREP